ncbi:glycosyltransferase involved in cell wall biosynthesis [Mucilaginibacter sp. UYNi724]
MSKRSILVTFDSMKHPNSGYYYFGKGLGNALIAENKDRFSLSYYMFASTNYFFERKVPIVFRSLFHKVFFPSRTSFELVHFTDQNCRLRPWMVNAKKVMTVHDINNIHLSFKSERNKNKRIKKLRRYISYCDKVVAISKFVANDIIKFVPEAEEKLSVIYNGADQLVVQNNHLPAYLPQKPFIFTIGLLSAQKGFHLLPALLRDNAYELVIAGNETPHKAVIIEEAIKHNCLDRLTITGPISDADKAWYFKNCEAFAFPSIAEGFGLPIIEAMHFGKPVFLSKFTSLPEVGGNVAYYFDSFEPVHMRKVFKTGMEDYINNNRAEAIIEHASKFSWQAASQQYLDLYVNCLES